MDKAVGVSAVCWSITATGLGGEDVAVTCGTDLRMTISLCKWERQGENTMASLELKKLYKESFNGDVNTGPCISSGEEITSFTQVVLNSILTQQLPTVF